MDAGMLKLNRFGAIYMLVRWLVLIACLRAAVAAWLSVTPVIAQEANGEQYHQAIAYCQMHGGESFALSADKSVLCFRGEIKSGLDLSVMDELQEGGLFVVESNGGNIEKAVELSNQIMRRRATVVVHHICFSACAQYLLIAPDQAFVAKGTLVAWHYPSSPGGPVCMVVAAARDGGPKRLQSGSCDRPERGDERPFLIQSDAERQFFGQRVIDGSFDPPADSLYVRRLLRSRFESTGVFQNVSWTLHPRYFPRLFKAKVIFEEYPGSQQEVDDLAARYGLKTEIIYDP
jgi:hypothetical protein